MNYDNPDMGCYVDGSHDSAQDLNERIVAFTEAYGWKTEEPLGDADFDVWNDAAVEAVEFLNGLESRTGVCWTVEDNSLFLQVDVDNAKEEVEFVSSKENEYPPDSYRGEWLHVNDHGNATLYVRKDGCEHGFKDEEVWSVV